jgi:isoquinoline 1-oxidoreductase beta subunit
MSMTKLRHLPPEELHLSRRVFLVGSAASGLMFGYGALPTLGIGSQALAAESFEPTVWYTISPDGIVTVICGKAEMGQHISSTIAQLIAEELGADWKDMRISFATNDPKYNDPRSGLQLTGGSRSVAFNFDAMSRAGAAGRLSLIKAASEMMGVPDSECQAQNSQVLHLKTDKRLGFAEIVASGKANKVWTPEEMKAIKLKTPDQYTLIGRSLPQLDIPPKVNGTAKFGIDVFLPGMVYGKLALPPVRYGATVRSIDDSAAKKVPGFIQALVIEDKTASTSGWVVAVAATYEAAQEAAKALKIDWDKGPNAGVSSQMLLEDAKRLRQDPSTGQLFVKDGNAAAALAGAAKVIEAEYTTGLNIHAPLEPMNATVEQKDGVWHIYTGNQFATRSTAITAAALGVDAKNVIMHQQYLGGGYGRRLDGEMIIPAVLASRATGKPVKLIYSREDDMAMDFTRPLTYQNIRVGLDADGKVIALEHDVVSGWVIARWGPARLQPSVDQKGKLDFFAINASDFWYSVPNHTVRTILNELAQRATPSGQWRAVGAGWTCWAIESAVDEAAHAAGKDPIDFRLAMLDGAGANAGGAQRLANVVRTAQGRSGYGSVQLPKGEGLGVACSGGQERPAASLTACVAQVAVDPSGIVKVKRLTLVTDVGTAINPDGVRAQVEGAALWGLSATLFESATLKNGAIEQANFDTYSPLRMADVPELDVSVIANGEPPTGCGEPAVTVVAPAIANAVFNAVGARVRALPITAGAVKAAMKA